MSHPDGASGSFDDLSLDNKMISNLSPLERSEHTLAKTSETTIDPTDSDDEVYVGLDGRRHVETAEGADQIWFRNTSSGSYSRVVPSETDAAVDDLRFEQLNDIFAKQAAFWKGLLGKAPTSTGHDHSVQPLQETHRTAWKLDLHLRQIIRQIARELGACCVLVIHDSKEDTPSWLKCEHPACTLPEKRLLPGATFFNIEPVTHWRSLALAEDVEIADGELEIFRRVPAPFHTLQWLGRMTFCTTCMSSLCKAEGLANTRQATRPQAANVQRTKDISVPDTNIPLRLKQPRTQHGLTTGAVVPFQPSQRPQKRPSSPSDLPKKVLRRKLSTSSLHLTPAPNDFGSRQEPAHENTTGEGRSAPTTSFYDPDCFMLGVDGAYDSISENTTPSIRARPSLCGDITRSMIRTMAEKAGIMVTDAERSFAEKTLISAPTTMWARRASGVSSHVPIRGMLEKGKRGDTLGGSPSNNRTVAKEADRALAAVMTHGDLQRRPPTPPLTSSDIEAPCSEQAQDSSIAITHTVKSADTPPPSSASSSSEAEQASDNHTLAARLRRDKETRQVVRNFEYDIRQEAKRNKRRHSGGCVRSPTSPLRADLSDSNVPYVEPTSPHKTHVARYRLQCPRQSAQSLDGPRARKSRRSDLTTSTQSAQTLATLPFRRPELWCYCRRPDDGATMIQCSDGDCLYGWFHMRCLLGEEKRQIKWDEEAWYCSICTSLKHKPRETASDKSVGSLPPPALDKIKIETLFSLPATSTGLLHPYGLGAALVPE